MEAKIDLKLLADGLSDILNRVQEGGERFVIECDGTPIATLMPISANPEISVANWPTRCAMCHGQMINSPTI